MLKIKIRSIIIVVLIFLGVALPVLAQNEQADYNYQYEKYTEKYQEFLRLKDEFKQYETLAAKDKMLVALQSLLAQRAEALRAYWLLLRTELRGNPGLILSEKNPYITFLTEQIIFLEDYKKRVLAIQNPTLQDLMDSSQEIEDRQDQYMANSYEVVSFVVIGRMRDMQADSVSINALYDQEIKTLPQDKQNFYYTWVQEANSQTLLSQNKVKEAEGLLTDIKKHDERTLKEIHRSVKNLAEDARLLLTKSLSYQQELLVKLTE